MVKHKRQRRTRLVVGLIVVIIAGAAIGVGVGLTGGGSGSRPRVSAQRPHNTTANPPSTHGLATPRGGQTPVPLGIPGKWKLVFDEEFNGNSLNQNVWNAHDGWTNQNGVTDSKTNVQVQGGHAILTLAAATSGAEIGTLNAPLKVGDVAEARIAFAGSGSTIYNWPAFWTSGPNWPQGGENDIAEGFGALTVNYHSPTVTHLTGPVPGNWAGGFHTYAIYRGRHYSRVYWDGRSVRVYNTADNGGPQTLLLTLGAANQVVPGPRGAMVVDYVRVWAPA